MKRAVLGTRRSIGTRQVVVGPPIRLDPIEKNIGGTRGWHHCIAILLCRLSSSQKTGRCLFLEVIYTLGE